MYRPAFGVKLTWAESPAKAGDSQAPQEWLSYFKGRPKFGRPISLPSDHFYCTVKLVLAPTAAVPVVDDVTLACTEYVPEVACRLTL